MNPPKHVAIIMDGNGRWGLKKKKSRNYGHAIGIKNVEKIIYEAISNKIQHLTLYTFQLKIGKDKKEITFLINLLKNYINKELSSLIEKNIKLKIIGNINKFQTH